MSLHFSSVSFHKIHLSVSHLNTTSNPVTTVGQTQLEGASILKNFFCAGITNNNLTVNSRSTPHKLKLMYLQHSYLLAGSKKMSAAASKPHYHEKCHGGDTGMVIFDYVKNPTASKSHVKISYSCKLTKAYSTLLGILPKEEGRRLIK